MSYSTNEALAGVARVRRALGDDANDDSGNYVAALHAEACEARWIKRGARRALRWRRIR